MLGICREMILSSSGTHIPAKTAVERAFEADPNIRVNGVRVVHNYVSKLPKDAIW